MTTPTHTAALSAALQNRSAAKSKREALAAAVTQAQEKVGELEAKASTAAAESEVAGIEDAPELARKASDAEAAATAARRILRNAKDALAHATAEVEAASRRVSDVKADIQRAHLNTEIAARLNAIRAEERELAFLISAARLRNISTPLAEGALDSPPARPTSAITLPNPGITPDLTTPTARPGELEAALQYWRERDAALETGDAKPAETAADLERAA